MTVYDRHPVAGDARAVRCLADGFMRWRDAGALQALLEGAVAEVVRRDEVDMSLVSVGSTTARTDHDVAGMRAAADRRGAQPRAAAERGPAQDPDSAV